LIAQPHLLKQAASPSATPWYDKQGATFADAIALVRMKIWAAQKLESSCCTPHDKSFNANLIAHLTKQLAYAA
ncbi:MAG TPA: hypothetical protein VGK19_10230, partial [Capsulimonadaceae bacterium]